MSSSSLNVAVQGDTPISFQWYRGQRGDTNSAVNGATSNTLSVPATEMNELYWVRITNPTTSVDSRAATVYRATSISYSDELDAYSKRWEPAGSDRYYKVLPFTAAVNGSYQFSVSASGFSPTLTLYQGVFIPGEPQVNKYAAAASTTVETKISFIPRRPTLAELTVLPSLPRRTDSETHKGSKLRFLRSTMLPSQLSP